jgi:hypothetical protein
MFRLDSSYTLIYETNDALFIKDDDLGGPSLTNDAEQVTRKLLKERGNKRIVYRDSMGNWDELVHDGNEFIYFSPIKENDPINSVLEQVKNYA